MDCFREVNGRGLGAVRAFDYGSSVGACFGEPEAGL